MQVIEQWLGETDFSDPSFGLIAAIVVVAVLTLLALRSSAKAQRQTDPLNGFFSPDRFEAEIQATERRTPPIKPQGAVLRGQIDHLRQVRAMWGPETRAEAVDTVAQVMRAGVRKTDMVVEAEGPDGESSFVILAHGASENDASGIAKRLLKTINRTKVAGLGEGMRLTASFGVASRRIGESDAAWRARADAALQAAHAWGKDQVVKASDWEEVKMLPAPQDAQEIAPTDTPDGNEGDGDAKAA